MVFVILISSSIGDVLFARARRRPSCPRPDHCHARFQQDRRRGSSRRLNNQEKKKKKTTTYRTIRPEFRMTYTYEIMGGGGSAQQTHAHTNTQDSQSSVKQTLPSRVMCPSSLYWALQPILELLKGPDSGTGPLDRATLSGERRRANRRTALARHARTFFRCSHGVAKKIMHC
jgi:hypothetical protein